MKERSTLCQKMVVFTCFKLGFKKQNLCQIGSRLGLAAMHRHGLVGCSIRLNKPSSRVSDIVRPIFRPPYITTEIPFRLEEKTGMAYGEYAPSRSTYQELLLTGQTCFSKISLLHLTGSLLSLCVKPTILCEVAGLFVYQVHDSIPGRRKQASRLWKIKMIMPSSRNFHAARCLYFRRNDLALIRWVGLQVALTCAT